MSLSNNKKLLAGAASVAAIAFLANVAPAQGYPPAPLAPNDCSGYQFPGGTVTLNYPGIGRTVFDTGPGTHVNTSATTVYDNGTSMDGSVTGDITGSKIHLTVTREGYTPLVLDGDIGAGNRADGNYTYRQGDSGDWHSAEAFSCSAAAAAAAPTDLPKNAFVVGGPIDIFNIAASDVPDASGHQGVKVGTLEDGQLVVLAPGGPCAKDTWCKIRMPGDREHFGFVNGHLQF